MSRQGDLDGLIARMGEGDRKAFGQFYSATNSKAFGLMIRVLGERALAEEALEETYVRVWRSAPRKAGSGLSPMAWLLTIARNAAVEKVRHRRTQSPEAPLPDPSGAVANDLSGIDVRTIEGHLATLDDDRAAAIRAAYLDGLTYDQLAARYEVPQNTMRSWLRRSLMRLRESMGA